MTWISELGPPPIRHALPELGAALHAAGLAANEAMRIYNSGELGVSSKADSSPVTKADISSNRIIAGELSKTPHPILSEESADDGTRLDADTVWIVDPLDGTADFVDRTDEFTIMIALAQLGRPVLGIIAQPAAQTVFVAQDGAGAYRGAHGSWERIRAVGNDHIDECHLVCSRNHLSEREQRLFSALNITRITKLGSSIKACSIASGEAHLYITTTDRMKEWDTCASWCVVTEAGGRMTDALGGELTYNSKSVIHRNGIVASSGGRIHEIATSECRSVLDQVP